MDAANTQAEIELAQRAHRGDVAAFDELVLRFQRPVYRLCRRMVGSVHAEDLAQDAFIRAFVHFDRFDETRPLLPWLLAIARRLCLDRLRRQSAVQVDELPVAVEQTPGPEHRATVRQELERLERALADLEEGPREAIVLFHIEEMSYRDIATTLDVPIGTVMTWLHRGRGQLKRAVDDATGAAAASERPLVNNTP